MLNNLKQISLQILIAYVIFRSNQTLAPNEMLCRNTEWQISVPHFFQLNILHQEEMSWLQNNCVTAIIARSGGFGGGWVGGGGSGIY